MAASMTVAEVTTAAGDPAARRSAPARPSALPYVLLLPAIAAARA